MLDGDDGSVSPDSPQWNDCTIRVFQLFGAWITHSHALQKYRAITAVTMETNVTAVKMLTNATPVTVQSFSYRFI